MGSNKLNQIAAGIIVLIIGIALLIPNFGFPFLGSAPFLVLFAGAGALLGFFFKRKTWMLIIATYTIWIGGNLTINRLLDFIGIQANLWWASLLMLTGLMLLTIVFTKGKSALTLAASLFFWLGANIMLADFSGWLFPRLYLRFGLTVIFVGIAFVSAYMLKRGSPGRWALYVGACIIAVGVIQLVGWTIISGVTAIAAVLLIVIAAIIIINALRKKG